MTYPKPTGGWSETPHLTLFTRCRLNGEQRVLLGKLGQVNSIVYGECKGAALDFLISYRLAEASRYPFKFGPIKFGGDKRRVTITARGHEWLWQEMDEQHYAETGTMPKRWWPQRIDRMERKPMPPWLVEFIRAKLAQREGRDDEAGKT